MTFSTEAWFANAALYATIRDMPFNRELADGTLARRRFQHYIVQDAHYLLAYARVWAMAAARADTSSLVATLADWAAGTVRAERSLHESYFARFGLDPRRAAAIEPTPTCFAYTNFLMAAGWHAPLPVLMAALLPCQWVYWEVGRSIAEEAGPDNPFAAWIETYSAPGFGEACALARRETDRLAADVDLGTRLDMHTAFRRAMQLEWMFWDSAWRLERWPVG